ncbi:MAG: Ig-like domain-containing protein [Clostridia bacterium]|nr:Ig-like domain-containing protein [Clostridia bacterium]
MKRSMIALALIIATLFGAAMADDVVIARAIKLIGAEESGNNYGCAITDSNGKSSLGFMQWNATRAAALMKSVIAKDEGAAEDILGSSLTSKLKSASSLSLSSSELKLVSRLLKTDAGVSVQNEKATADVSAYFEKAASLGIKDRNALCYYCDIVHQVGTGAIKKYHVLAAKLAGGYEKITLEHMYKAALNYATYTKARRTRVYEKLVSDPIGSGSSQEQSDAILSIDGDDVIELHRYEKIELKATLEGSDEAVYWKSSSKKIAKVTKKGGVVRGIKKGYVKITAYTQSGLSDTVTIKVVKPASASKEIQRDIS